MASFLTQPETPVATAVERVVTPKGVKFLSPNKEGRKVEWQKAMHDSNSRRDASREASLQNIHELPLYSLYDMNYSCPGCEKEMKCFRDRIGNVEGSYDFESFIQEENQKAWTKHGDNCIYDFLKGRNKETLGSYMGANGRGIRVHLSEIIVNLKNIINTTYNIVDYINAIKFLYDIKQNFFRSAKIIEEGNVMRDVDWEPEDSTAEGPAKENKTYDHMEDELTEILTATNHAVWQWFKIDDDHLTRDTFTLYRFKKVEVGLLEYVDGELNMKAGIERGEGKKREEKEEEKEEEVNDDNQTKAMKHFLCTPTKNGVSESGVEFNRHEPQMILYQNKVDGEAVEGYRHLGYGFGDIPLVRGHERSSELPVAEGKVSGNNDEFPTDLTNSPPPRLPRRQLFSSSGENKERGGRKKTKKRKRKTKRGKKKRRGKTKRRVKTKRRRKRGKRKTKRRKKRKFI